MDKKTIYLLNVDNYSPEITAITYPLIEQYAKKIGAEVFKITERKYPDAPVVYEKLQIYDLAQERKDDWIIYFDSDCLVHPDLMDLTDVIDQYTVLQNNCDDARIRFKYDRFFRRDGRNIGTCNWMTVAHKNMIELWKPPDDMTIQEIIDSCFVTFFEAKMFDSSHLVDDFVLARNVAKYGLKYKKFIDYLKDNSIEGHWYFYHLFLVDEATKIKKLAEIKEKWLNPGLETTNN